MQAQRLLGVGRAVSRTPVLTDLDREGVTTAVCAELMLTDPDTAQEEME